MHVLCIFAAPCCLSSHFSAPVNIDFTSSGAVHYCCLLCLPSFLFVVGAFFFVFLFFSLIQVVHWFSRGFGRDTAGDGIVTSGGPCWIVVGIRIGGGDLVDAVSSSVSG
jgi:hypothetical protein